MKVRILNRIREKTAGTSQGQYNTSLCEEVFIR